MTELDGTLSELARLRSGSEPIVSLYLDIRWKRRAAARARAAVRAGAHSADARRTTAPGTPGREGLERTLERIQDHVSGLAGAGSTRRSENGLALFACESARPVAAALLHAPVRRTSSRTDGIPHLTPARAPRGRLRARDRGRAERRRARTSTRCRSATSRSRRTLRGFVPRGDEDDVQRRDARPRPGASYEREDEERAARRRTSSSKNRRAAAAEVTALFDQNPRSLLVLVGTSETVAAFERELPERLRSASSRGCRAPRELGVRRRQRGATASSRRVAQAVAEREKEDEHRDDRRGRRGRRSAAGSACSARSDVVEALNQGRVHTLVIEEDFDGTGWRCDNCDALGANAESAEICPYCGGELRAVRQSRRGARRARALGGRARWRWSPTRTSSTATAASARSSARPRRTGSAARARRGRPRRGRTGRPRLRPQASRCLRESAAPAVP